MQEPQAWLIVVDGPADLRGQTYPLPSQAITLGRGDRADFQFELGNISRVHTKLTPHGQQQWILRDLSSLNGTYIGDRRITEEPLDLDQEFRLANSIVFRLTRAPAEAGPKKIRPEPTKPHDLDDTGEPQPAPPDGGPAAAVPPARPAPARPAEASARPSRPATRPPPAAPPAPAPQPAAEDPSSGTQLKDVIISSEHAGEDGSVLVVRIRGRLDAYNYTELGEILQQAIDAGERSILLDLSHLGFVDHTGLGVLVRTATRLDKLRGQVRLVGVRQKLLEAFSLSRLDVIFKDRIATDEATAVADLCSGTGGKFFKNPFKK
jgi:anti-sigma B factor antagonist